VADSVTLGELIVGAGTLALAAFTAGLGWETRVSAKAAREAVEGSEEPFVIATPTPDWRLMRLCAHERPQQGQGPPLAIHRALGSNGDGSFVRLRLWNIGQGPAIVTRVRLAEQHGADLLGDLGEHHAVGAGEVVDIEISPPRWADSLGDGSLTIEYVRASGLRYATISAVSIGDPTLHCRTYTRYRKS
jgi:hypothetical protein